MKVLRNPMISEVAILIPLAEAFLRTLRFVKEHQKSSGSMVCTQSPQWLSHEVQAQYQSSLVFQVVPHWPTEVHKLHK